MERKDSTHQLRNCLSRLFDARHKGTASVVYAHEQGVADGYMKALSDLGVMSDAELLRVVSEERCRAAQRAEGAMLPVAAQRVLQHFA